MPVIRRRDGDDMNRFVVHDATDVLNETRLAALHFSDLGNGRVRLGGIRVANMGYHAVIFAGQPIDVVFAPAVQTQDGHIKPFIGPCWPARSWCRRLFLSGLAGVGQQSRSRQRGGTFQEIPTMQKWMHGLSPQNKLNFRAISLRKILSEVKAD